MKTKLLFLFICITLTASGATTYEISSNGLRFIADYSSNTATVTYNIYHKYTGVIVIPSSITYNNRTLLVTSIGESAFANCTELTSVTIPNSVKSIQSKAFYNCNLKAITIPGSVTSIGDEAFRSSLLRSVTIPFSVTSIGSHAFANCGNLTSVQSLTNTPFALVNSPFYGINSECTLNIPYGTDHLYIAEGWTEKVFKGGIIPRNNHEYYVVDDVHITEKQFQETDFYTLVIGEHVEIIDKDAFSNCTIRKTIWKPNVRPSGTPACAEGMVNYCSSTDYPNTYKSYSLLSSIFEVDGIKYVPVDNTTCDVIDCNYSSEPISVNIGATVTYRGRTLTVRHILDYACYADTQITGDIQVSNQGDIGDYAFYGCTNATGDIQVSNQGNVENFAFYGCINALTTDIGNNGYIGQEAFSRCKNLTTVNIHNTGYVGKYAFRKSTISQQLDVLNSSYIGNGAFLGVEGDFIANINNQGDLKYEAFKNTKISTLSINTNVTNIGSYCFSNSNISQEATLNNWGNIDVSAFTNTTGSYQLTINNKGALGNYAFYSSDVKLLSISNNVTSIGSKCFYNSQIVTSATLSNHGDIGVSAFGNTTGYNKGHYKVDIQNIGNLLTACFKNSNLSSVTIGNGITSLGDSCFASSSGYSNIELPNSIDSIGKSCFQNCTSIQTITLSPNLKKIPDYTFAGCSVLKSLTIPSAVDSIHNNVFDNCPALATLIFATKKGDYVLGFSGTTTNVKPLFNTCGLKSLYVYGRLKYQLLYISKPYSPFMNHQSLKSVILADNETNIYDYEFSGCTALYNIQMGKAIKTVGDYAFSECSSLPYVKVGTAVQSIGDYSFSYCTSLKQIDLSNVVTINIYSFNHCSELADIKIPKSTRTILDYTFKGCTALKDVIIEDRVDTLWLGHNETKNKFRGLMDNGIPVGTPLFAECPLDSVYIGGPINYSPKIEDGYSPFFHNDSLRSVTITNNEETIYTNEFYNCWGLTSLTLGPGVKTIKEFGFQGCSGLLNFEFAETLESIGKEAFSDCRNITHINSYAATPPTCGDQALADINFFNCTVYVPSGCVPAYEVADQWGMFFIKEMEPVPATAITLDKETLTITSTTTPSTLTATVTPAHTTDKSVTWASSEERVLTVDDDGVITVVGNGTATVTATTNDGSNLSASCTVTVNLPKFTVPIPHNGETIDLAVNIKSNSDGSAYAYIQGTYNSTTQVIEPCIPTDIAGALQLPDTISFGIMKYPITEIHAVAFLGCDKLTSIAIPNTVTVLFTEAFINCDGLDSLYIPKTVTGIYYLGAILTGYNYSILPTTKLIVDSNNTVYYSPNNCNAIIDKARNRLILGCNATIIPDGVVTIESNAFLGLSLQSITLPSSITKIRSNAFGECRNLRSVISHIETPCKYTDFFEGIADNCVLTVPYGTRDAYIAAGWTEEVFKGGVVEAEPTSIIAGDANGDGEVDVFDVTEMVNHILGSPSEGFVVAAADLNGDGEVDVFDVTKAVNIILGTDVAGAKMRGAVPVDETGTMLLTTNSQGTNLMVDDAERYVAMQFDVVVPTGETVEDVTLNSRTGHAFTYEQMEANRYRVIAYSMRNASFKPTEDALVSLTKARGASIENAVFVTADGHCIHMTVTGEATGIEEMTNGKSQMDATDGWYTLDGHKLSGKPVEKGVYIRNNKKYIIK